MFKKILIANRGEITVRIIQACRELEIRTATIYSEADSKSLHVRLSDEAYCVGPPEASKSYLNIPKIISIAKEIGADAIHPGYGFLSENADFIRACDKAGITFIGPSAETVELMGNKTAARDLMSKNGVPITPGNTAPVKDLSDAKNIVSDIGLPIIIKAAAGGGGKGMRIVRENNELEEALSLAQNEAGKAFNNPSVFIEKYIEAPKHIEVQIFGDKYGNYVHMFERECSVQRRHQKVLEEAPSLAITSETREKITKTAIEAARACNYYNAGTIEFLLDEDGSFYFMEMNTRLQVEHPVTELITGIDLVKEQINVAAGNKLSVEQADISFRGHAIECRIYAEDIDNNFTPSTGKIYHHKLPSGPGIRVDRGIDVLTDVPIYYDPILAKVITYGVDRKEAIARMKRALGEYKIVGVKTNIDGFRWIFDQESFLSGKYSTNFLTKEFIPLIPDKWKNPPDEEYLSAVYLLSAYLKNSESKLKPSQNNNSSHNRWSDQNND
ncbi:MAG: acetyl-CoA carboxylase biotin carboxylase subunit [Bacteroidetes bacterium]|nr:acetyl-CoA carboxylase biotin carboxylase subunit [Bacteroidota bacterium]